MNKHQDVNKEYKKTQREYHVTHFIISAPQTKPQTVSPLK